MAELSQIRQTLQYNACKNGINMTGKNKNREKYGKMSQNLPLYPRHNNPK